MTPRVEGFSKCGCGRSPSGYCIGWHGIPPAEWELTKEQLIKEFNDREDQVECIKLNGKELAMPGHSRMVDIYCEHFGIKF